MEKVIQQMQFKDRLCRTLLRLNLMIAVMAMLPVFSKIFIGMAAVGAAFYLLILLIFTIMTLGILLLNDSFRALYDVNLDGLQELSEQIIQAYHFVMPVLAILCVIISGIVIFVTVQNGDELHKRRKVMYVTADIFVVFSAVLLFYVKLI